MLSLHIAISPTYPMFASSDTVKWSRVNIPTEGKAGNWVLADGSDVQHLTMASDGTLYAYGKGLTYTLYRSTDRGFSWSYIGNVQDAIVDIAIVPNDTDTIYYATSDAVYRSTDGGNKFYQLPANPGGAGSANIEITSLDVSYLDNNIIAVGTRDTDSSQFGGAYTLDEEDIILSWTDTNLGNYDVYTVAFSPSYSSDRQLVAVVTDETDTFVSTKIGDAGWGATIGNARLNKDNSGTPTSVAVATSATIAFPSSYESDGASENYVQFVAIDTGTDEGDVYKIDGAEAPTSSSATDLNAGSAAGLSNIDVTGLAACGDALEAYLLAGAADSAQTYFSADSGKSWTRSRKEPTGGSKTYVIMSPDFGSSGEAYTATSGDESAFSVSLDNGSTWNQISLIDTDISTIVDLAPSPNYSQDNTLFMLTYGSEHSLWRSLDGGSTWERTFGSTLTNVDSLKFVGLSPQYSNSNQRVFIAGSSDSHSAIWESTNNGQTFKRQFASDPTAGTSISIDTWALVDDTTLLIGSGSNGLVYCTTNRGFFYSEGVPAGDQSLNTIVISPSYENDGTILVGNTSGWIYWSGDNGNSFEPLPPDVTSAPLTGTITVAFDTEFARNRTVYAASNTADEGVYRFILGTSTDWETIDSTLPSDAKISQLMLSGEGTLYAANIKAGGGMERSLDPTYALGPTFETVTRGLNDAATLSGLWRCGHRIWSLDNVNIRLMTFNDSLTTPVNLTVPDSTVSGIGTLIDHTIRNVSLDWETLEGANTYKWQLDYDTDFSSVPDGFEESTEASSTRLPTLEPANTYYWRVRATAPVLSPWSPKWSFTTSLDTEAIALKLESPTAGASEVPIKPVFQWTAVAGADAYELLVSTDTNFNEPSIIKKDDYALSSTAWRCDLSLDYETTYYWKVRAISHNTQSPWSAAGAFTTEAAPTAEFTAASVEPEPALLPEPSEPAPSTMILPPTTPTITPAQLIPPATPSPLPPQTVPPAPALVQPVTMPSWVIYLIGALLLTIILTLVIILTLAIGIRRR